MTEPPPAGGKGGTASLVERAADVMENIEADIAAIASIPAIATILDVVCRTTGMGFAAVARVTETRWIACAVDDRIGFGLKPGGELAVATTICDEIRQSGCQVVIDCVADDPLYRERATPAMYGFQSYISIPIVLADGRFFGTLCAIDPNPARVSAPETLGMFRLFADLIAFHLEAQDRLALSEASLGAARENAAMREQFIAVLGHDLRNPLASIDAGARSLLRTPLDDRAKRIVGLMQSTVVRMAGLIDNMLDFARGRLGGGLTLQRSAEPLRPVLEQVVAEMRLAWPDRAIGTDFALGETAAFSCDRMRIAQLLSNLVANALAHGSADGPVCVTAAIEDGVFALSVANSGEPIPEAIRATLFQPFAGGPRAAGKKGLGLGLYIASEIARAHGGGLEVASGPAETRFTFRMPVGA